MIQALKILAAILVIAAAIVMAFVFAVAWVVLLASAAAGIGIAYLAYLFICWLEDKFG